MYFPHNSGYYIQASWSTRPAVLTPLWCQFCLVKYSTKAMMLALYTHRHVIMILYSTRCTHKNCSYTHTKNQCTTIVICLLFCHNSALTKLLDFLILKKAADRYVSVFTYVLLCKMLLFLGFIFFVNNCFLPSIITEKCSGGSSFSDNANSWCHSVLALALRSNSDTLSFIVNWSTAYLLSMFDYCSRSTNATFIS